MAKNKKYEMLSALRDELNAILGEDEVSAESTVEAAEEDYEEMSFNELKKLCKSKGLSAKGNREELIARLSGGEAEEEEPVEEEKPKRGRNKKSEPEPEEDEDEEDDSDDEDDEDEDEEDDIQSQVEAATEDMSLEELAEFCKDNGLSPKGKRPALISRIVKAVEAGDIELSDDDDDEDEEEEPPKKSSKKSKKSEPEEEEEDDSSEEEVTEERAAALKAYKKDTEASFKKGELERDDLVEFLCDFYDKDKKTYKKASDKEILSMYIEASSNLIDDGGEIVEEGAYTVNGVPYCCGRPLKYDEDEEQYVCEHCGNSYEADED